MIQTLSQIKFLFRTGLKSSVGKNAISLYVLYFANFVLPLMTIPYVLRMLGPEKFGAVSFGQSLITYLMLVVNYGFDLSATRDISVHRDDPGIVNRIAASVWGAKLLLMVISFLIMLALMGMASQFCEISLLLFILFGTIVGNALFPTWLFQGLERMVSISSINLAMRLVTTLGIFVLIHRPADFLIYAGLISFQWLGAGFLGIGMAFRSLGVEFVLPSWQDVKGVLVEGWELFLSMGAVKLYTAAGNTIILGLLTDYTVVGYYSAAEKVVRVIVNGFTMPVSQAVYPRFSKMALESKAKVLRWARWMFFLMGGLGLLLSLVLFVTAPFIVDVLVGDEYAPSVQVIRVLAPLPFLIGLGSVLGKQIMLPFRRDRARLIVFCVAGVINIVLAFLFIPLWEASGTALAALITELFVTSAFLVYLTKNGISPFRDKWNNYES